MNSTTFLNFLILTALLQVPQFNYIMLKNKNKQTKMKKQNTKKLPAY